MGEVQLPSIWGEHSQAVFEPVIVRGRLVTVLMDVPAEWNEKLLSLDFKRSGASWVRIGAMAQAEYQFLSPEISLVAMRADRAFDSTNDDHYEAPVPVDLADAVLHLWQRQRSAIGTALLIEQGEQFTDGAIWSTIETLLDGGRTPAVDTLLRLSASKLASLGRLTPEAEAYAKAASQELEVHMPTAMVVGKLLVAKGEAVSWTEGGAHKEGRAASDLKSGDRGFWAYDGAPIYVGGYTAHPPVWIAAENLRTSPPAPAIQNALQPEALVEVAQEVVAPLAIQGTQEDFQLLEQYCLSLMNRDPVMNWNGGQHPFVQNLENAGKGESAERFRSFFSGIAANLTRKTAEHFEGIPLEFRLCISREASSDGNQVIRYGVTINVKGVPGYLAAEQNPAFVFLEDDFETPPASQPLRTLDFSKADEAYQLLSSRRKVFLDAAKSYSAALGEVGVIIPSLLLDQQLPAFWKSLSAQLEGQVTEAALLDVLAATYKARPYLDIDFLRRRSGTPVFEGSARAFDADDGGRFEIQITQSSLIGITLADASRHISGAVGEDWLAESKPDLKKVEAYLVSLEARGAKLPTEIAAKLPSQKIDKTVSFGIAHYLDRDEAVSAYNDLLEALAPQVASHQASELEHLRKSATSADLADRFRQVPEKLKQMPKAELEARIKAELHKNLGPFGKYPETRQKRIVEWVVGALREGGVQGVVVAGAKQHYWYDKVQFTAEMLSQSREAEMGFALANYMDRLRGRKQGCYIDGVSIADPDLAAHVNGEGPTTFSKEKSSEGVYSDTGVVAGFAAKDIRGLGRSVLLEHASLMNDGQKTKYLTKDLIWPRKSLLELREKVTDVKSAFFYDLIWRSLPKAPKSNAWAHVQAFISLVAGLRSDLDEAVLKPFTSSSGESFHSLAVKALDELFAEPGVKRFYGGERLKAYGTRFDNFSSVLSHDQLMREASEADWSQVVKDRERAKPKPVSNRVTRNEIVRIGPDYRNGQSVTPEDFIRTFGFSGVEYGNYTSLAEREKNLNFAYDSMMDFVRILGWEPMLLSLGGRLGLCFGSRGHGGRSAPNAHFEPANMAINLTRMRGDGCLAHEYFHAIANHFGKIATGAGTDLLDSFASPLMYPGAVPPVTPMGRLRAEVLSGFHNLIVAIMRAPGDSADADDLSQYTRRSSMLASAIAADEKKDKYWSLPSEMFARAMEVWFKQRLDSAQEQNDYLVADSKAATGGVYPTTEHMDRISVYADRWVSAIQVEMQVVNHNYLGQVSMPVLFSQQGAKSPMSRADLFELADAELTRLFGRMRPGLSVHEFADASAGYYDLAAHLLALNPGRADRGTFYHEAWHAAHATLLRTDEQLLLAEVFKPGTPLVDQLEAVLRDEGMYSALDDLSLGTLEIQAYAFQMWELGKFTFGNESGEGSFNRVDEFISGVECCADLLGGAQAAQRLFERFRSGELGVREPKVTLQQEMSLVDAEWDDGNLLVWNVQLESGAPSRPPSRGMQM